MVLNVLYAMFQFSTNWQDEQEMVASGGSMIYCSDLERHMINSTQKAIHVHDLDNDNDKT